MLSVWAKRCLGIIKLYISKSYVLIIAFVHQSQLHQNHKRICIWWLNKHNISITIIQLEGIYSFSWTEQWTWTFVLHFREVINKRYEKYAILHSWFSLSVAIPECHQCHHYGLPGYFECIHSRTQRWHWHHWCDPGMWWSQYKSSQSDPLGLYTLIWKPG